MPEPVTPPVVGCKSEKIIDWPAIRLSLVMAGKPPSQLFLAGASFAKEIDAQRSVSAMKVVVFDEINFSITLVEIKRVDQLSEFLSAGGVSFGTFPNLGPTISHIIFPKARSAIS